MIWIEIASRDEAGAGKNLVDRTAERFLTNPGLVGCDPPARKKRIGKAADRGTGQQGEKASLARRRIDAFCPLDHLPQID